MLTIKNTVLIVFQMVENLRFIYIFPFVRIDHHIKRNNIFGNIALKFFLEFR